MEEVLSIAGLDPQHPDTAARLWNCDETGILHVWGIQKADCAGRDKSGT